MDTRERLLEAAVNVFEETGFRGATTRRIAEEAGVNEVTLFRHFGSKDALLRAALRWSARQAPPVDLPEEPEDPERELTAWCRRGLEHLYRASALIRTSMGEFEEHPEASESASRGPVRAARELTAYLERLRERGFAHGEWDAASASALLMGAVFSDAISRDVMPERYPYGLEEAASEYVRLFLRAIGVERGGGPRGERE